MYGNKMCNVIVSGLIVLICQLSGIWTHKECGLLDPNEENLPWIANIYQLNGDGSYEFICSGTIVSGRIILTAARCFYDDITKKIRNATFSVTIGQKHKAWNPNSNQNIQIREIPHDNIFIAKEYKGLSDKYACNIAIVRLGADQKFKSDGAAKKACVYWDNDFVESDLEVNSPSLKTVVWGDGKNTTFTTLEPSYVNFDMCYSLVPKDFQPFLTFDKMCVEIEGLHSVSGIGSGLYALNAAKNRWYLIGVSSELTTVDSKVYITFTKMQPHLNWISNTAFLQV